MIITVSRPVVLHRTVRLTASGSMTGVDFRNREVRSLDPGTHTTDEITGLALAGDPIAMGGLRALETAGHVALTLTNDEQTAEAG